MKHTPGSLEQNSSHLFIVQGIAGKDGANICTVSSPRASDIVEYMPLEFDDPDFEEAIANAKHLVACWNACEGMDDPAAEIAKLQQDKADSLEALESMLQAYDPEWPGACHQDCFDTSDGHGYEMQESAKDEAKVAIAKATK